MTTDAQRATLERILELGGPEHVFMAGQRFDRFHEFPLFLVLLNSDSVTLVLEKIARLNRYLHSHHRHRVIGETERSVELDHLSIRGAAPAPVESLFVAGLYLAVLDQVGCVDLRCAFPESTCAGWSYEGGRVLDVPDAGTDRWRFEWADFVPRQPLTGLDELILQNPGQDLEERSIAVQVIQLVERDLGRQWRVREVAAELMMSPRSLQRRLHAEKTSFTGIVGECRIANARRLLLDTANSVTDIGYMLGFSDTPHFTRTFSAAVGSPPSQWRARARADR